MPEIKSFLVHDRSKAPGNKYAGRRRKDKPMPEEQKPVAQPVSQEPPAAPVVEVPAEPEVLDLLDVSDVPLPPQEVKEKVEDEIGKPVAFNWAILGSGQGGGRLAHQFWNMGYRRVVAVNTAQTDIKPLQLPEENKLIIGTSGAGGKLEDGFKAAKQHHEDIHDIMRRKFGTDFDRILITATAGGGTGSGSAAELVDICGEFMDKLELRKHGGDPKVGVILALPKESDGKHAHYNAFNTFTKLYSMLPDKISPLIVIDNQRISKLYPDLSVEEFWTRSNQTICSIFHLINVVSARHSEYTSFDKADLETILQSGLLVFGATPMAKWDAREDMGVAIRDNLKRNVLVGGLDLSSGSVAGCVLVANKDVLRSVKQDALDDGFSMLGRMLSSGSAVHRGIYAGNNPRPVVYTMIGGLAAPVERLRVLQRIGGIADWDDA